MTVQHMAFLLHQDRDAVSDKPGKPGLGTDGAQYAEKFVRDSG